MPPIRPEDFQDGPGTGDLLPNALTGDTPSAPPAEPTIPVGLATRLGTAVAAVFGLIALITAVLEGDHSQETIIALILAALNVFIVLGGRYAQAALAEFARRW